MSEPVTYYIDDGRGLLAEASILRRRATRPTQRLHFFELQSHGGGFRPAAMDSTNHPAVLPPMGNTATNDGPLTARRQGSAPPGEHGGGNGYGLAQRPNQAYGGRQQNRDRGAAMGGNIQHGVFNPNHTVYGGGSQEITDTGFVAPDGVQDYLSDDLEAFTLPAILDAKSDDSKLLIPPAITVTMSDDSQALIGGNMLHSVLNPNPTVYGGGSQEFTDTGFNKVGTAITHARHAGDRELHGQKVRT